MYLRRATASFLKRIIQFPSQFLGSSQVSVTYAFINSLSRSKARFYSKYGHNRYSSSRINYNTIIAGQAAIILGINANPVMADASHERTDDTASEGGSVIGLRKVEDGSVISNEHTSKWRVFTDIGRESFLQGKLGEAERFFISALEEAKKGFGNRDPHVASACNNLAEMHRVKKEFNKAEPLYLEAINILEESFGPDDIRMGAALHNLGQFYFVQRKLEEARKCYERALKIKRRVLGHGHTDYGDTMYHLGTVLYLQGKEKDAEDLIQDSIQILEGAGQGESILCIRRLRYLSQMYLKSNCLTEAENVQRKILHVMELSKGWNSMDTVISAERLALTLQAAGGLKEAQELLERCLDSRKASLPQDHIQIAANFLHIARVAMLKTNQLKEASVSEANAELDMAKDFLYNSIRIAQQLLDKLRDQKVSKQKNVASEETRREARTALIILLQSLAALGLLGITKQELQEPKEEHAFSIEAESALVKCISAYKQFESERFIADSHEVKFEYLLCLNRLFSLINDCSVKEIKLSVTASLQQLNDEIKRVEGEISSYKKPKSEGGRY